MIIRPSAKYWGSSGVASRVGDVGQASDGLEAVLTARELAPDLILLDITMPGMDGTTAGTIIHQEAPHTEMILVSQNDDVVIS